MADLYSTALSGDDIRLLTISAKDEKTGLLICNLTTHCRNDVDYDALSYTWGHPERTAQIICNNVVLKIPPPLGIALDNLHEYQRQFQRPIWIDAIALNQEDLVEKQQQVPLMFEVYHQAKNVIIWLGPADETSDDVMNRIPYFKSELSSFHQSAKSGFPHPEDQFWPHLGRLLHRPWFSRLWTLQETVLNDAKVVMCGNKQLSWTTFTEFLQLTNVLGCRQKINQNFIRDPFRVNAFINIGHCSTLINLRQTTSLSRYLLAVLDLARWRQCALDVDHVYAILGILPSEIRASIKDSNLVDYRFNSGDLFTKIARNYLLTADVGLHLLSCATSFNKKSTIPSWCPDWASKPSCARFMSDIPSYRAGISEKAHPVTPMLRPGAEETQLHVQGLKVDRIKSVGIPWLPSGGEGATTTDDEDKLRKWEESCRRIALETIEPHEFLQTYLRTMIGNVSGVPPTKCADDFSQEYEHFRHLNECPDEPCPHIQLNQARYGLFCASLGQNCTGRVFFSTHQGRVGMGPHNIREGDSVCALLGGKPLYVLRQASVSSTGEFATYHLIGEAYVDSLMEGQALRSEGNSTTEDICLV